MVMKTFVESWQEAVEKKNSILCAGLDPAECAMGRTDKGSGLPAGTNKREWGLNYVEAVAPFVPAIKPNMRYWGRDGDIEAIEEIIALAHDKGLLVIQDSKEPDIGETNDSGIFTAAARGMDALTLAAFAGNVKEAAAQAADRRISLIGMCLMSNPDYKAVKNMWVDVSGDKDAYASQHIKDIDGVPHVRHYMQLARDAGRFGLAGIVIGAPSATNHILAEEIANAARYFRPDGLVLVPGIGAQGGEVPSLSKYFKAERLICNVGRALMFPKGAYSGKDDWKETAKQYQEMLNELRTVK